MNSLDKRIANLPASLKDLISQIDVLNAQWTGVKPDEGYSTIIPSPVSPEEIQSSQKEIFNADNVRT